jgi:hypothetical protein
MAFQRQGKTKKHTSQLTFHSPSRNLGARRHSLKKKKEKRNVNDIPKTKEYKKSPSQQTKLKSRSWKAFPKEKKQRNVNDVPKTRKNK